MIFWKNWQLKAQKESTALEGKKYVILVRGCELSHQVQANHVFVTCVCNQTGPRVATPQAEARTISPPPMPAPQLGRNNGKKSYSAIFPVGDLLYFNKRKGHLGSLVGGRLK